MENREEQRKQRQQLGAGGLHSRGVVRTRGFVAPSAPAEPVAGPVRTRGAVRTQGPAVKARPWEEIGPSNLESLLDELREALERYPLSVVVDNPQLPEAQAFLQCLRGRDMLAPDDALWVLGESAYENTIPAELRSFISECAYLNRQDMDQHQLAETLVPDLLFIGLTDDADPRKRLTAWENRVWAVIIAAPGEFRPGPLGLKLGIPGEEGNSWRLRWSSSGRE